jgi:3-methyladenine DNA glycosylase AlkC
MAEPLKNMFGVDVPERLASMIVAADPEFDSAGFLAVALDGYEELELTPRARQVAVALRRFLPDDVERALGVIVSSLGPELGDPTVQGMEVFLHLPLVFFVADYGLDTFEASMSAQYELTKRFTAEYSIRAFLDAHPERSLARLAEWARDPNVHVRRLVSEGTRPRLPWAPRLRRFIEDPTPVIALLDMLKDDPEPYVRRSVANNLNDIAKDHPDLVAAVCADWMEGAGEDRRRLIRHGLRTLVKRGHPGALAVLGYGTGSPLLTRAVATPHRVAIGGRVSVEIVVDNPTEETLQAVVDLRVGFVKANGSTSPKVFKVGEPSLEAGGRAVLRKSVSLARHTTRTPYPGRHTLEILVNGEVRPAGSFLVE